jgi:hypothetical protein
MILQFANTFPPGHESNFEEFNMFLNIFRDQKKIHLSDTPLALKLFEKMDVNKKGRVSMVQITSLL